MSPYRALHSLTSCFCGKSLGLGLSQVLNLGSSRSAALYATVQFHRHFGTVPPPAADNVHHEIKKKLFTPTEVVGHSGCRYLLQRVLQDKGPPIGRVYLAIAGDQTFVVKEINDFDYYLKIYHSLPSCPYLRLLQDTIPEQCMFIYKYFTGDLSGLAQKNLPIASSKRILKDTLRCLAVLHDQNIVHNDVKANNIVIDWDEDRNEIKIAQVQLTDLEDAAHLPPGFNVRNKQVDNWMWRSPEAHTQARVNIPSDMFSFGVVCIYAVHKRVIFAVNEAELGEGELALAVAMERQISYFADVDGMNALLKDLGGSPWSEVLTVIWDGFNETNPRTPFSLWKNVDAEFKDLIGGLTNFDPAKRLTAHEALAHSWFAGV